MHHYLFSMNNWDRDLFLKAWDFATIKHAGQTYGGPEANQKIDYINHIGAVTMELMWMLQNTKEECDTNLLLQCAVLHDTIEDTEVTYKDINDKFGKKVANGVAALTKNAELETKKQQMLDSLKRIKQQPKEIWMVKMADRITNLSEPPYYWTNDKITKYYEEAQIIYSELNGANTLLSERFQNRLNNYLHFQK